MSLLKNFPLVTQTTSISTDGTSPNKASDCVPASIGATILWYQGKSQWDNEVNPDRLLDMAYPEGYQGGTAAIKFVEACKQFGVRLTPIQGDNEGLVKEAHSHLTAGTPVIFTIVDPYMPASSGYTHVCVWYADGPGTLTAMDPWPGKPVTHSDAEWEAVMRFNEIWVASKIVQPTTVSGVPEGWHYDQPSHTLTAPNGVKVALGFCTEVLKGNWPAWCHPVVNQYYRDPLEDSNPALGPGDQQPFNDRVLGYPHNPQHPFEGLKNKVIVEYAGKELVAARQIADARWQQVQKYYNLSKQLHDTAVAVQADNVKLQADVLALQQALPK